MTYSMCSTKSQNKNLGVADERVGKSRHVLKTSQDLSCIQAPFTKGKIRKPKTEWAKLPPHKKGQKHGKEEKPKHPYNKGKNAWYTCQCAPTLIP